MIGDLAAMTIEGFALVPRTTEGSLVVKVSGSCDAQAVYMLEGFLTLLHRRLIADGLGEVALDCEELYFMSSSALKTLVSWLEKVRTLRPPQQRYRVTVRLNRSLAWQTRSFGAIRRSAPDVLQLV